MTNKAPEASKRVTSIRDNSARLGEKFLNKARNFGNGYLQVPGEEEVKFEESECEI